MTAPQVPGDGKEGQGLTFWPVQGQINGAADDWHKSWYRRSDKPLSSRQEAIDAGLRECGHDDFNIAVIRDGAVVSVDWMDEPREQSADEIAEVAAALGLAAPSSAAPVTGATQHLPAVAEGRAGWSVYCVACSDAAQDYVYPCEQGRAFPPAVLVDARQPGDAQRQEAYENGRWCGECRYGVVEDPPCCFQPGDRLTGDAQPEHPEATCQDCSRPNATWFVSSPLWNWATEDHKDGRAAILCPSCFILALEAQTDLRVAWELRIDDNCRDAEALRRRAGAPVDDDVAAAYQRGLERGPWQIVTTSAPDPQPRDAQRALLDAAAVERATEALRTSRLSWGVHTDRWNDDEWQRRFWREAAEVALAAALTGSPDTGEGDTP